MKCTIIVNYKVTPSKKLQVKSIIVLGIEPDICFDVSTMTMTYNNLDEFLKVFNKYCNYMELDTIYYVNNEPFNSIYWHNVTFDITTKKPIV